MSSFFCNCNKLASLDLSNFETLNVTNFESMFSQCNGLKEIKGIEKFNTSSAINMSAMFECCV